MLVTTTYAVHTISNHFILCNTVKDQTYIPTMTGQIPLIKYPPTMLWKEKERNNND
jgi:hypothetical protein